MFECITRAATLAEAARRPSARSNAVASYGCGVIFFGIVPGFLLWRFFNWIVIKAGYPGSSLPVIVAPIVAVIWCASCLRRLAKEMKQKEARKRGRTDEQVEEWRITATRVWKLIPLGDDEPVLCFEVGPEQIVMLKGQWLWDEEIYGAPRIKDDPDERFENGQPAPYSFPTKEFVVVRWPASGDVFRIKPMGDYLAPEKVEVTIKNEYRFRESEIFRGSLDELQAVLDREAEKSGD